MRIYKISHVNGNRVTHLSVMIEYYPDDSDTKIAWVHSRWHVRKSPVRYLMFDKSFTDAQILNDNGVHKLLEAYA